MSFVSTSTLPFITSSKTTFFHFGTFNLIVYGNHAFSLSLISSFDNHLQCQSYFVGNQSSCCSFLSSSSLSLLQKQ